MSARSGGNDVGSLGVAGVATVVIGGMSTQEMEVPVSGTPSWGRAVVQAAVWQRSVMREVSLDQSHVFFERRTNSSNLSLFILNANLSFLASWPPIGRGGGRGVSLRGSR